MFGQIIPEGGFQGDEGLQKGTALLKSMKTQELREVRENQIKEEIEDSVLYQERVREEIE